MKRAIRTGTIAGRCPADGRLRLTDEIPAMRANDDAHDTFETLVSRELAQRTLLRRSMGAVFRILPRGIRRLFRGNVRSRRHQILDAFAASKSDVTFVQIGSCDGVHGDPIYKHVVAFAWSGVVVEPVPYVFARLRRNYADNDRVACENVAIDSRSGRRKFWHLRQSSDDLPPWYDQIGSFNRDHVVKHSSFIPNIEDYIVEADVECLTLEQLLHRHGIEQIDVFHTDAEGHDREILGQFDFEKFRPYLIIYEHIHLSVDDRRACEDILREHGYCVLYEGNDVTAYLKACMPLAMAARRDAARERGRSTL